MLTSVVPAPAAKSVAESKVSLPPGVADIFALAEKQADEKAAIDKAEVMTTLKEGFAGLAQGFGTLSQSLETNSNLVQKLLNLLVHQQFPVANPGPAGR